MAFDFNKWNKHFSEYSYVEKYKFSDNDIKLYNSITPSFKKDINKFIFLNRWYNHISSLEEFSKTINPLKSHES